MENRLRVGVVGTGWVANQHVRAYRKVADELVDVVAACDPREDVLEEFADRHGIPRRFASAGDLIASGEIDALVLLTPPSVRDEIIFPSIERGIQLLIEKPFGTTGANAVRYTEAAEAGGITLAVGQNFRWFPEYQWLSERLGRADTGAISYLEARSFQNRPQAPDVWRARERKLEMAIYSVHLIDRLQWIAGSAPVAVSAMTRRAPGSELPGEQFSSLLIEFADGFVGHMTSTWLSKGLYVNDFRVDTSTGSAHVRRDLPMHGDATAVAEFGGEREESVFADSEENPHGTLSYGYSMREFALALREGRQPIHSGRDNLKTMGIMEAAYLSAARGGAPVSLGEALSSDAV
jgi:D-apiose dehydrogenase